MPYFRVSGLAPHALATATSSNILEGYTAIINYDDTVTAGTMSNKGSILVTDLLAGSIYHIPEGYHNGTGQVKAKDLASQTQATAYSDCIYEGQTAWINGQLVVGTATFTIGIPDD